jgi:hypothetical protein
VWCVTSPWGEFVPRVKVLRSLDGESFKADEDSGRGLAEAVSEPPDQDQAEEQP